MIYTRMYAFLADIIVSFHFLYVMFVVLGLAIIIIGRIFKWRWIHNPWFRVIHFLSILVVAGQAIFAMPCPLTIWENNFRIMAGQKVDVDISFIGRLLRLIIFYRFPPIFFTILHVSFATVVFLTLVLIPPHFRKRKIDSLQKSI